MHRFIWDLRYPGPWEQGTRRAGRGALGPLAAPGTYTVRLTVDGAIERAPLVLRADPRVTADGVTQADLEQQLAHNLRVRDAVSRANHLRARVDSARKRLANATGAAADTLRLLTGLHDALVTAPIRYSEPRLLDQLTYLYGMTMNADQRIGRDAVERLAELERQLDELEKRW
jgi:hypothetical protein